jgi:hypothetical protein
MARTLRFPPSASAGTLAGRAIQNGSKVQEAQMYSHKAVALAQQLATGAITYVHPRSDLAGRRVCQDG